MREVRTQFGPCCCVSLRNVHGTFIGMSESREASRVTKRKENIHWNVLSRVEASQVTLKQRRKTNAHTTRAGSVSQGGGQRLRCHGGHGCVCIHTHVYTRICIHMSIYMYIIYVYMYIYICVYVCVCALISKREHLYL